MINLKADEGKPRLSLVPPEMITQAARVMEYGEKKYGTGKTWKDRANRQQYIDALARHTTAFWADPDGVDGESGLPHLSHVAANVAFLCELMYGEDTTRELTLHRLTRDPYQSPEEENWGVYDGEKPVATIRCRNGEFAIKMNSGSASWFGPYGSLAAACTAVHSEYNERYI